MTFTDYAVIAAISYLLGSIPFGYLLVRTLRGKGVATAVGAFLGLAPKGLLGVLIIFGFLAAAFRYISLGSIVAIALFPLFAYLFDGYRHSPRVLASMYLTSAI